MTLSVVASLTNSLSSGKPPIVFLSQTHTGSLAPPYTQTRYLPAVASSVIGSSVIDLTPSASPEVDGEDEEGPLGPKVWNSSVWFQVARCSQRQRSQNSMTKDHVGKEVEAGKGGSKEALREAVEEGPAAAVVVVVGAGCCCCCWSPDNSAAVEAATAESWALLRFAGGAGTDMMMGDEAMRKTDR